MRSTVSIRPAELADFEAWFALFGEVAAEGRWIGAEAPVHRSWAAPMFEHLVGEASTAMFLAEIGPTLVGYLSAELELGRVEVGMAVRDGHRGTGVGSALLDACIGWSRDHHAHKVTLSVFPHNERAIALYDRFGFRPEGRLVRHWRRRNRELWDVIPMGLHLDLEVRHLARDDVELLRRIDRSEHVDVEYHVLDGVLVERPVSMAEIPTWDAVPVGEHSVDAHLAAWTADIDDGGVLLGVFEGDEVAGLAVVQPSFEPPLARFAHLFVSRPFRRRGVASALWAESVAIARATDARTIYVSATPTGSAVGFYLSRGCRLADPPHPALLALEPDDVHLIGDVP